MGRASKIRARGAERHQRCDSGPKGLWRKATRHLSLWRRQSGPSAPSSSLFSCLLDVRESRGAPRPCLGGPAFDPKHTFGSDSRPHSQRAPQLVFVEVFFSGVPQKTGRTELLLPLPQAQRRPHGAGLEPAGPKARLVREAIRGCDGRDTPGEGETEIR